MPISAQQLEQLLPLAVAWTRENETRILQRGVSLQASPLDETALQMAARTRQAAIL